MEYISYQGHQIAYRMEGKGNTLVWLHGFCEDSRMWEDFTPDFEEHQHIYIDLPSLGQSDVAPDMSIEWMAEAVHAVLKHLKIKEMTLIGHSMGGYVSLAFAKKYPDFLTGLCLFHSHPFADSEDKKLARNKAIDFVQKYGHVLYIKQLIPALFESSFAKSNAFLIEKMTMRAVAYQSEGIVACLKAMRDRTDNSAVLAMLNCPVLFIVGKEDAAVPEAYSMKQLYLPAIADIHILPKVGHMGMFEATKNTQRILHNFCSK